ncbi:UNVERIFIED_CONTAM: hypothetical protein FKN15_038693 [Acipenser sinensis]
MGRLQFKINITKYKPQAVFLNEKRIPLVDQCETQTSEDGRQCVRVVVSRRARLYHRARSESGSTHRLVRDY